MATFWFNNKKFYIDGRLKERIDEGIIPDLKKRDKDVVFCVDGKERSGKSVCTQTLAAYVACCLGTKIDSSNICMTPDEFRRKIENANKNEVVIYDEAHRGMGSASALSEVNRILKDLMMEMGQKNLVVFVVLPTFFLLERYVALFRTRGLFHVYERKRKRGFWCYFNEKKKFILYMNGKKAFNYNCMRWPRFRGRFLDQYAIDEAEYREKKRKSFKKKERYTKAEVYIDQRNKLINILHKVYSLTIREIERVCKAHKIHLKRASIGEILNKFKIEHGEER